MIRTLALCGLEKGKIYNTYTYTKQKHYTFVYDIKFKKWPNRV